MSKEANVRIKLLRLEKVQQDQILNAEEAKMKAMAVEVEAKRAVLNAKLELAEAQALAEEEQSEDRSQDLSDLDAKALTAHERVIRFLEKSETDLRINRNSDSVQMVNAKGINLRHDAPSWNPNFKNKVEFGELHKKACRENNCVFVPDYNGSADYASASQNVMFNSPDKYGSAKFTSNLYGPTDASPQLTVDELAKLFVRCREPPNIAYEDKFDGDPSKYHQFIVQFQDTVLNHYEKSDPAHALVRLVGATRGRARKIVEACQMEESSAQALQQALADLREAFGAPQLQVNAKLREIREGPSIKLTADSLQDFYVSLVACRNLLCSAKVAEELDAPATTEGVFRRLPPDLQRRFVRFSVDRGYQMRRIPFDEVLYFIKTCRDEANSNFGRILETVGHGEKIFFKNKIKTGRSNAVHMHEIVSQVPEKQREVKSEKILEASKRVCPFCSERHGVWKCQRFLNLSMQERRATAKSLQLCFCCLRQGHRFKVCTSKYYCRHCNQPHNTLLHIEKSQSAESHAEEKAPSSGVANKSKVNSNVVATLVHENRPCTRLKVLPVLVKNLETGASCEVHAFLDGGADCHLITKQLFEELGLSGDPVKSCISLANGSVTTEDTLMSKLLVRGLGYSDFYELSPVIVKESLADVSSSIPIPDDINRNPHLAGITIPVIEKTRIDLIIGLNARILHEIHEKREAGSDKLCAGRCLLGWFLYGNDDTIEQKSGSTSHVCFVSSLSASPRKVSNKNIVEKQSEIGTTLSKTVQDCLVCLGCGTCQNCGGTGNRLPYPDPDLRASSVNDDRAQLILDRTCTLVEGHYQIGLLWASDNPKLPDNFAMAKARLNSLGKRLQSNPEVKENYRQKVDTRVSQKIMSPSLSWPYLLQ